MLEGSQIILSPSGGWLQSCFSSLASFAKKTWTKLKVFRVVSCQDINPCVKEKLKLTLIIK